MIKPLLRTIPTLSGNVSLLCGLSDYSSTEKHIYECNVRTANMVPLHSNKAQHKINIGLLNSSYEFDIKKYYKYYNDIFYSSEFSFSKTDYTKINKTTEVYPRNIDFEFGCKRNVYQKNGTQFIFYAPIWCDSYDDLPDTFNINIRINNNLYDTERTIKVHIKNTNGSSYNYLDCYLNNYLTQIDSQCIFCLPKTGQATYYGIDIENGGFKKAVDNIINKAYKLQNTINNFDAIISNGWKRNKLIIKQIIPLAFEFNLNDILSDNDKIKFANAELHISGAYVKDEQELQFYDIDCDYTTFTQDVYKMDDETGIMEYVQNNTNIMDVEFPALNDGYYEGYRYSNKLAPMYNRWKLKYSSDDEPYITNMSWAFSSIQGSTYKYKEFPEVFNSLNVICDSDNNIILPLGNAIGSPSSPYANDYSLLQNYINIINNHCSSWFDTIESIDEIFNNTWTAVEDNKAYCHGILYDISNIYKTGLFQDPIDFFNVFVNINFIKIDQEDLPKLKTAKYSLMSNSKYVSATNCILSNSIFTQLNDGNGVTTMSSLYLNEEGATIYNKNEISSSKMYLESKTNTGDFIDLMNYGIDLYDVNRYYKVSEIIDKLSKEEMNFNYDVENMIRDNTYSNYIINGKEFLPIYRLNEVFDDNNQILFANNYQNNGSWITNSLLFSQDTNFTKNEYDAFTLRTLNEEHGEDWMAVPLYIESEFISYYSLRTMMYNTMNMTGTSTTAAEWISAYIGKLTQYEFNPILEYNDEVRAKNVFTRLDTCIGKRYGDFIPRKSLVADKDLIYVDSYNLNNVINEWNANHSAGNPIPLYTADSEYDYDINDYFDILDTIDAEGGLEYMWTEIGANPDSVDYAKKLPYWMRCASNNWNYVAYMATNNKTMAIYYRDVDSDGKYVNVPAGEETNTAYMYTFDENYGNDVAVTQGVSNGYETLNDNNSYVFYAKILNPTHLHWYMSNLYNNFDLSEDVDTSIESLYIKKRMIINDYESRNLFIKDKYMQLLDFYSPYIQLTDEQRLYILNNPANNIVTYKKVSDKYYSKDAFVQEDYDSTDFYYKDNNPYSSTYGEYVFLNRTKKRAIINGTETYDVYYIDDDGNFISTKYNEHTIYYIDATQVKNEISLFSDEYIKWIRNIKDKISTNILFNESYGYWYFDDDFNVWNDVDSLAEINDMDGEDKSSFKFEIYYKKRFIKLNKNLYRMMNVDNSSSSPYKDLYLYKIYKESEYPENMKYYYTEDISIMDSCEETTRCLKPLFDSVYLQDKENTVVYKEYNQNKVIPTTYAIWTGNISAGIMCGSTQEEVENKTGQTAIQAYCPYHVHWFWYSAAPEGAGIHTPNDYGNYYRYDTDNVSFMIDISNTDLFNQTVDYETGSIYQNWPIKGTNNLTGLPAYYYPSEYFDEYGDFLDVAESGNPAYAYLIKTYDLVNNCYSEMACLCDDKEIYSTTGLNTYSYGGSTYAFYAINAYFDNTSTSFNMIDDQYSTKKYFTKINGNDIYDNYDLEDTFKMLVPMTKLTLLQTLYKNNTTLVKPSIYNIDCYYKQSPLYNENGEMYAYNITKNTKPYSILSLERYFDSITPYIKQTSNIDNAYNLKFKNVDAAMSISYTNDVMYKEKLNIYKHIPIRIYTDNSTYTEYEQVEYKYFNDNKLINLEESFGITAGTDLVYNDMISLESTAVVLKTFKEYMNKKNKNSFNDNEILFLFKKYKVEFDSYSIGLDITKTEKRYTLTYKFKLQ